MKKQICIVTIILVLCGLFILPANAEINYYPAAAANYALEHTSSSSTNTACNVFVINCLKAGELSNISGSDVVSLRKNLLNYGTEYSVVFRSGTILAYSDDNPNISVGDVVFYHCKRCSSINGQAEIYPHTAIITQKVSGGLLYYSQHNGIIHNDRLLNAFHHVMKNKKTGEYERHEVNRYIVYKTYTDKVKEVESTNPLSNNITTSVIHLDGKTDSEIPNVTGGTVTKCSTTEYEVTCTASDNQGIVRLVIGTWNDAIGISNAKWQSIDLYGKNVSHTFKINIADFDNRQNTVYHSNVYAYDGTGNESRAFRAADILIETEKPVITEAYIENVTKTSYDVVCKATDNGTVHRFTIGTWHNNMSVDDAVWQTSDTFVNEARFTVRISSFDNAQNVIYHTNVYAIDLCGNWSSSVRAGDPMIETVKPSVTQCDAINITDTGYDVVVTGTDNSCLKKLQIGTWHSGIPVEQAQWQEVGINQQNSYTYTFHIDIADFDNARNVTYYTNAYAIDLCGNASAALMSQHVPINERPNPDFILPSGTVTVEEYAFQGCAFTYVRLSDDTVTLKDGAFADCPNLKHVYMPEKTVNIGSDVFPSGITIHGKKDSYAKTYADLHGYSFIEE